MEDPNGFDLTDPLRPPGSLDLPVFRGVTFCGGLPLAFPVLLNRLGVTWSACEEVELLSLLLPSVVLFSDGGDFDEDRGAGRANIRGLVPADTVDASEGGNGMLPDKLLAPPVLIAAAASCCFSSTPPRQHSGRRGR